MTKDEYEALRRDVAGDILPVVLHALSLMEKRILKRIDAARFRSTNGFPDTGYE